MHTNTLGSTLQLEKLNSFKKDIMPAWWRLSDKNVEVRFSDSESHGTFRSRNQRHSRNDQGDHDLLQM